MEIKDYCDINGEPICVGDKVHIYRVDVLASSVIGQVHSISNSQITIIDDNHNYGTVYITDDTAIEIISKYKKEESKPDMVNHPPHYQSDSGIEVIDVIEAFTADLKGGEATNTGNVIKYILRWPHKKNPLEDLKKARWYLDRLIKIVEAKMEKENA